MASELVRFKLEGDMPLEQAAELRDIAQRLGARVTFEAMSDVVSPSVAIDMIRDERSGLHVMCVTKDSVATWLMETQGFSDGVANTQAEGIFMPIWWHAVYGHERNRSWSTCACCLRTVSVRQTFSTDNVIVPRSFAEFAALGEDRIGEIARSHGRRYGKKRIAYVQAIGERITRDLARGESTE